MKRFKSIFIIISILLIYLAIFKLNFRWECVFKKIFHISCPGCGLTRSFRCIFNLDLIGSIRYNILGIPIFIGIVISILILLKDIIRNENTLYKYIYNIVNKYYILIFILLIITMIINNINGV